MSINMQNGSNGLNHLAMSPIGLPQWVASLDLSRLGQDSVSQNPRGVYSDGDNFGPVSVIDRDDKLQVAWWTEPSTGCLFFDGYILGLSGLAASLDCVDCDTPTILSLAYRKYGKRMFEKIDGAFLIATWDSHEQEFLLGHDCLSKHPVYFTVQSGKLWFSSNILALSRRPEVQTSPNRLSLVRRLMLQPPAAGATCFEGIQRVRPGHYLSVNVAGQMDERQYWHPLPATDEAWMTEEEALDGYEPLLVQAVNHCLDIGVNGILLSGGTDSVSVAALAVSQARERGISIPVACMGKGPPGYSIHNDALMQDRVAGLLDMPIYKGHALDWLEGKNLLEATLSYASELPGPTTAFWLGAFSGFYRDIVTQGIHTAMSGSGGDEWMGLHGSYFGDLLWRTDFRNALALASATARGRATDTFPTTLELLWRWGIRFPIRNYARGLMPTYFDQRRRASIRKNTPHWLRFDSLFLDEALTEMNHDQLRLSLRNLNSIKSDRWYRTAIAENYVNPYMYYELERRYLLCNYLGIRLVSPFQCREVIQFFNRIPPDTLIRSGVNKGLLREIIQKHLGDPKVISHPKVNAPDGAYVDVELYQHLDSHISALNFSALRDLDLVDVDAVKSIDMPAQERSMRDNILLFALVSTEVWLRAHF